MGMNRSLIPTGNKALSLLLIALATLLLPAAAGLAGRRPSPPSGANLATPAVTDGAFVAFAAELEQIRQELRLPSMSAAIVQDQEIVWAQGFGYTDVEAQVPATADTPYHLASVTKPIAATLLLQLVEEGRLSLDDPVSEYGIRLPEPGVTVRYLLTHTSAGTPGTVHNYDGNRYSLLARVFAGACGAPFGECLANRFINPLGLEHTAANPAWGWSGWSGYMASMGRGGPYRHFPRVYRELARPYQFDTTYDNVPGAYPLHFSPAAGLLASVTDIARFDIALDRDQLVRAETKAEMFAPALSNAGQALIYGLGWYTQNYKDIRLIWHSGGWSPSVSALYLKVPDENLTFIVLANSYNLTRPYPFDRGDVLYSTPAIAFYKRFVFPRQFGRSIPAIDGRREKPTWLPRWRAFRVRMCGPCWNTNSGLTTSSTPVWETRTGLTA